MNIHDDNDGEIYHPLTFVDQLEKNKHIMLLYDDQKYAFWIIARFFLNGLNNGESCIFFTSDDPNAVENRLNREGIDVRYYKNNNLLRIYTIEIPDDNKRDTLRVLKHIRKDATKGMKPPYRFAGRTITDTETKEGMRHGIILEEVGHENFDSFNNSQMCFYDISKIEKSMRPKWIQDLLKAHHCVIYASEPNKAVAFETNLLEDE
ncbi:MAG TPA: MEDS domain-containing protein [Candidatus Nitrosocosmicus sp.]|nr:MEDS domain-containing protein [Candidatus Nitrosocosmicus sp.]